MLLAMFAQEPLAPRVRYLPVAVKCGAHQAALSSKEGVLGRAAVAAAGGAKKAPKGVTATAARIYKYLLADYLEEFVDSIRKWVHGAPEFLAAEIASQPQAAALQALYTKRVVPDAVVDHVQAVLAGLTDSNRRQRADAWVRFLVDLLRPDDHPSLSRFFTYRCLIDGMLTMAIVAMPPAAFVVTRTKPRKEGQKRLRKVHEFFGDSACDQALRRASLIFQLTGGVEARMSKNPKVGDETVTPAVVAVVNEEVHRLVAKRLGRVLGEI